MNWPEIPFLVAAVLTLVSLGPVVCCLERVIVEAEADLKAATSNPSLVGNECVTGR